MARNTRFTPYDERFDEGAGDPDYGAYQSPPSMAMRRDPIRKKSVPLFLADEEEAPRRRGFGSGGEIYRDRPALWPRIFKIGMVTAAAAGIALAIASMDNPLNLFANAKASLPGTAADQPAAAPSTTTLRAADLVPTLPPTVGAAPTRGEIAAAPRVAHQGQPEIPQPNAVTPPARRIGADEIANLLKRAKGLIAVGDIAPARLLLERAADAQEASAALLLAQTYDPAVLGALGMRSVTPDPAQARAWYQKAAQLGSPDAQQIIVQSQKWILPKRGHHATLIWNGDSRHDDGRWLHGGAGRRNRI
jgi:hypothetical protein